MGILNDFTCEVSSPLGVFNVCGDAAVEMIDNQYKRKEKRKDANANDWGSLSHLSL